MNRTTKPLYGIPSTFASENIKQKIMKNIFENDPLKIIGAAKVKELVWHEDAFAIGFNFGLLTSLVKLDMSVEKASGYRNGSFMASTNGIDRKSVV